MKKFLLSLSMFLFLVGFSGMVQAAMIDFQPEGSSTQTGYTAVTGYDQTVDGITFSFNGGLLDRNFLGINNLYDDFLYRDDVGPMTLTMKGLATSTQYDIRFYSSDRFDDFPDWPTIMTNTFTPISGTGSAVSVTWDRTVDPSSDLSNSVLGSFTSSASGTLDFFITGVIKEGTGKPMLRLNGLEISAHDFNQAPIADCGQERAVVFDSIMLDDNGSYDPEGSLLSYEWILQHENGTTLTVYESNPLIENLEPGFIDVTLKVTDDQNASGTDTMLLAAAGPCVFTASTMYVESIIAETVLGSKGQRFGEVIVTVYDDYGKPVAGATVTGTFTSDFNEAGSGVTDGKGVAVIRTSEQVKKPLYDFCVDAVVKDPLTYVYVETCVNN